MGILNTKYKASASFRRRKVNMIIFSNARSSYNAQDRARREELERRLKAANQQLNQQKENAHMLMMEASQMGNLGFYADN